MREPEECPAGDPEACPIRERRTDDPRWAEMGKRMDGFESALRTNTAITQEVKTNTDNIVAIFESGRAFFRVMGMAGAVAKWVTKVAAAVLVVWAVFRYGVIQIVDDLRNGGGK